MLNLKLIVKLLILLAIVKISTGLNVGSNIKDVEKVTRYEIGIINKIPIIKNVNLVNLENKINDPTVKYTYNQNQSVFSFDINCNNITETRCQEIEKNLKYIDERLQKELNFKETAKVYVELNSYCNGACNFDEGFTIAQCAPTAYFTLNDGSNIPYLYPQALVKQLNLDKTPEYFKYDIYMSLNSDINFVFKDENELGEEEIDFIHIVTHELVHGLGMISSINQYLEPAVKNKYFLPYSFYEGTIESPKLKKHLPLNVFDKHIIVQDIETKEYNLLYSYIEPLYSSSEKLNGKSMDEVINIIENDEKIYNGLAKLYNDTANLESSWIFNCSLSNNSNSVLQIPIESDIYGEYAQGVSLNHLKCGEKHMALSYEDGLMCSLYGGNVVYLNNAIPLLNEKSSAILNSIGYSLKNTDSQNNKKYEIVSSHCENILLESMVNQKSEDMSKCHFNATNSDSTSSSNSIFSGIINKIIFSLSVIYLFIN